MSLAAKPGGGRHLLCRLARSYAHGFFFDERGGLELELMGTEIYAPPNAAKGGVYRSGHRGDNGHEHDQLELDVLAPSSERQRCSRCVWETGRSGVHCLYNSLHLRLDSHSPNLRSSLQHHHLVCYPYSFAFLQVYHLVPLSPSTPATSLSQWTSSPRPPATSPR